VNAAASCLTRNQPGRWTGNLHTPADAQTLTRKRKPAAFSLAAVRRAWPTAVAMRAQPPRQVPLAAASALQPALVELVCSMRLWTSVFFMRGVQREDVGRVGVLRLGFDDPCR
jgi:hypothetical protein